MPLKYVLSNLILDSSFSPFVTISVTRRKKHAAIVMCAVDTKNDSSVKQSRSSHSVASICNNVLILSLSEYRNEYNYFDTENII